MTESSRTRRNTGSSADYSPGKGITGMAGWVIFAGIMLVMLGFFQAIEGLVALFNEGFYLVGAEGLVVNVDYTAWGWTHLILGLVAVAVGFGLMAGNMVARVAGIAIAMISAIVNLVFISAYPVWSTIVIAVDVIVIYAIVVHGRELKSMRD
jgi:tetrahydromethanopterin S-methyltransferase subunit F